MPFRRPWAFELGTLWAMDLDGNAPILIVPRVAAVFYEVPPIAAESLAAAMGLPDSRVVQRRFEAGRRCFAARIQDSIAAYGWVSQGVECIGELEQSLHMRHGEAYIWDCATVPRFRRQRIYAALLGHIAAVLQHEGIDRVWIGASLHNSPSIRGFMTAGFQPVVRLTYLRVMSLRHIWITEHTTASPALLASARRALSNPEPAQPAQPAKEQRL